MAQHLTPNMSACLTPEEEAAFGPTMDRTLRSRKLQDLRFALTDFCWSANGQESEETQWFQRVLCSLVGGHVRDVPNGYKDIGYDNPRNRAHVVQFLEEQIEAAVKDQQEWFEDDPEDWKSYNNKPAPDGHPWGDAEVALLRAWCKATPYEVWQVKNAVNEAVQDALGAVLIGIACYRDSEEDSSQIAKSAFTAFEKSLKAISERLQPK